MADVTATRGERNLNPGNLNFIPGGGWTGQLGLEIVPFNESYTPRFARYDCAEHGIRAIAKQLLAYQDRHDCQTVRQLINRWAPPSDDNATDAYVGAVCNHLGVTPDDPVNLHNSDLLQAITFAVIRQENGRCLYTPDVIASACADALGNPPAPQAS